MDNLRVHNRVAYRQNLECYHYYSADGQWHSFEEVIQMEVFDVSLGGLGIVTKHKFSDDIILEFTLYLEAIPYPVMALIKWVKTNGIFYRYGLEILGHNNMLFRHLKAYVNGQGRASKS